MWNEEVELAYVTITGAESSLPMIHPGLIDDEREAYRVRSHHHATRRPFRWFDDTMAAVSTKREELQVRHSEIRILAELQQQRCARIAARQASQTGMCGRINLGLGRWNAVRDVLPRKNESAPRGSRAQKAFGNPETREQAGTCAAHVVRACTA